MPRSRECTKWPRSSLCEILKTWCRRTPWSKFSKIDRKKIQNNGRYELSHKTILSNYENHVTPRVLHVPLWWRSRHHEATWKCYWGMGLNTISDRQSNLHLVVPFDKVSAHVANTVKNICTHDNIGVDIVYARHRNVAEIYCN